MADAAVAEPSAPSGAPPPAPPPSGAEPQSGAPNGAPQAGSEQAGAEPATPPPVPYLTFKAERSRLQGQMRDVQRQLAEAQQYRDHYGTLQQQHAELAERYNNFNALANVIRQNPEIAQQIEEALGQDTARGQEQAIAQLPPEAQQVIQRMGAFLENQDRQQQMVAQRQEQGELANVHREVQGTLTSLLEKKGFEAKPFLPLLESYVLNRLRGMGESAEFSDIPLIAAEWFGAINKWHQAQLSSLSDGKRRDGMLPASPGSSAPVSAAAPKYALDETATQRGIEMLKGLGWKE